MRYLVIAVTLLALLGMPAQTNACPHGTFRTHVCLKRGPSTSPSGKPPYLIPGKCKKWDWKCERAPPPIK
jgi:hypothetical protein